MSFKKKFLLRIISINFHIFLILRKFIFGSVFSYLVDRLRGDKGVDSFEDLSTRASGGNKVGLDAQLRVLVAVAQDFQHSRLQFLVGGVALDGVEDGRAHASRVLAADAFLQLIGNGVGDVVRVVQTLQCSQDLHRKIFFMNRNFKQFNHTVCKSVTQKANIEQQKCKQSHT